MSGTLWLRAEATTTSRSLPSGANRNDESRIPSTSRPIPPKCQKKASKTCVTCFIGVREEGYTLHAKTRGPAADRSESTHMTGSPGGNIKGGGTMSPHQTFTRIPLQVGSELRI